MIHGSFYREGEEKMLIIPKVGDWVNCNGKESQGKVSSVSENDGTFTADFFTEAIIAEEFGGTESGTLPFSRIAEIITNQPAVDELEKELKGEV